MISKQEVKRFFWSNKEGIIIGGIVGYLLGRFFLQDYFDVNTIMQTQGIIDVVQSGTKSVIEIAKTKIIWTSTIIGALIGMIVDIKLPERFWK